MDHKPRPNRRLSTDTDAEHGEAEQAYPCVQGLIAANVALMTAYANPDPLAAAQLAAQRHLLARKVVSNLFFLCEHPLLSPSLRQVMGNAHRLWVQLAERGGEASPAAWAAGAGPTAH